MPQPVLTVFRILNSLAQGASDDANCTACGSVGLACSLCGEIKDMCCSELDSWLAWQSNEDMSFFSDLSKPPADASHCKAADLCFLCNLWLAACHQ